MARRLHEQLQDAAIRDRLRVLRAATEEGAVRYVAILSVFEAARERYEIELSTDVVALELDHLGVSTDNLEAALNQLADWGNLTRSQDTARAARLEDFKRRKSLWQLTAAGTAAYDAVVAVVGANDESGSLQSVLLRDITDGLAALRDAYEARDPEMVYSRLRDLDRHLRDLAANARDFHGSVIRLRREHDVDPERFLVYKHVLMDYLQNFLDHLSSSRERIATLVRGIEAMGVDELLALAAAGDDSVGLFDDDADHAARQELWRQRWTGLVTWFVTSPGQPSGADDLDAATTSAIRDLMAMLRRVVESERRPMTRATELVVLARWFRRLESNDAAAELFDAAFGLGAPLHLSGELIEPDATGPDVSWFDAPSVFVPVSLRERGRSHTPAAPQAAIDYRANKALLALRRAELRQVRADAAALLLASPIEGRVLSESETSLVFEMLNEAAPLRPRDGVTGASLVTGASQRRVVIESAAGELVEDPAGMTISTHAGTFTINGFRLNVSPAGEQGDAPGGSS